jgi:hypothetical protein
MTAAVVTPGNENVRAELESERPPGEVSELGTEGSS